MEWGGIELAIPGSAVECFTTEPNPLADAFEPSAPFILRLDIRQFDKHMPTEKAIWLVYAKSITFKHLMGYLNNILYRHACHRNIILYKLYIKRQFKKFYTICNPCKWLTNSKGRAISLIEFGRHSLCWSSLLT